ncbi:hypothetical protein EAH88_19135 [Rhodanobacter glycinis]|uniref:Heme-copper oxidase subunit III family profile domain-containing protein n=1 Tax=Rhodanobacter glycinis TaxID=582702 RepID=A0A502BSQ8_9GAMM|nr:hypothetical protein EAH88_19135 [Rhodanobacter glycinis]
MSSSKIKTLHDFVDVVWLFLYVAVYWWGS